MSKRSQFLVDISKLILYADGLGIRLICFDFDRSQAEQEKNVLTGKSWTKNSRHLVWQAMDLALVEADGSVNFDNDMDADYVTYEILGTRWENMGRGHVWGAGVLPSGKRRDIYHFELQSD